MFQSFTSNLSPYLISGPCSAETEEQLLQTAIQLRDVQGIHLLRAGIWKPRTKPGGFEGVGVPGLTWLHHAGKEAGLQTTTEVASAYHVEQALKHQIDVLWIGARTTVNPFLVHEIADALKGVEVPLMIKNPINPDVELWTGAFERFVQNGLDDIAFIHRGFSSFASSPYRNSPMWQIPIEMKRRFPQVPMICDPSHICGNRSLLKSVAQKSIDLDFQGLMIESHITPDQAWSDAAQQITPHQLKSMLGELLWREPVAASDPRFSELMNIRAQIDLLDDEIISILSERMKLADQIGHFKKEHNIAILQTERWNEILNKTIEKAKASGLSEAFIRKYFDAIHMESIFHQNQIMNS